MLMTYAEVIHSPLKPLMRNWCLGAYAWSDSLVDGEGLFVGSIGLVDGEFFSC